MEAGEETLTEAGEETLILEREDLPRVSLSMDIEMVKSGQTFKD